MAEELNIYQKLAKIRKSVEIMRRTKKGFNYKYVPEDEILAKVTALMDKYDLSVYPGIVPGTLKAEPISYEKTKASKDGKIYNERVNEVIVSCDEVYTWVNNNNPEERIVVPWALVGQQTDGSQALGSGLTYSNRYFLLKYFNSSTSEDDPDAWRTKQRKAEEEDDKLVAQEIIAEIDKKITEFIKANEDKKEEVKKLVGKYVKDSNYHKIVDSKTASRLLSDFTNTFLEEKGEK